MRKRDVCDRVALLVPLLVLSANRPIALSNTPGAKHDMDLLLLRCVGGARALATVRALGERHILGANMSWISFTLGCLTIARSPESGRSQAPAPT